MKLPLADSWGTNRFGNFCKLGSLEIEPRPQPLKELPDIKTTEIMIETVLTSGGAGPKLLFSRADAAVLAAQFDALLK